MKLAVIIYVICAGLVAGRIERNETITLDQTGAEINIERCYLTNCIIIEFTSDLQDCDIFTTLLISVLQEEQQELYNGICAGLNCTRNMYVDEKDDDKSVFSNERDGDPVISIGRQEECSEPGCFVNAGNIVNGGGTIVSVENTAISDGDANAGNIVYADQNDAPINMVSSGNTAVGNGNVNAGNILIIGDFNGSRRKLMQNLDQQALCGESMSDVPPCCLEVLVQNTQDVCDYAAQFGTTCEEFQLINGRMQRVQAQQTVQVCP
eukprot:TRINITY_DN3012_c0_g1_i2.p2 TRINITY_DN3012_c0_g1~~TRINITY_DN3012_c0_g1_i2.p2  ORF type:complete len:265 (-),score=25.98 TRINITY_DN3012_c0_g1_i2:618-1412(-)